jgi:endonuclease YncB( thermonuclease family)
VPVAVAVLAIGLLWWWQSGPGTPLSGRAFVIDGDTLRVGSTRVRLTGLDAPELGQDCTDAGGKSWPCGERAKDFLAGLADRENALCASNGRDRYGRTLATCRVGGTDLGSEIVRAGWAVADMAYFGEHAEAQSNKRGIWSGSFVAPAEWRRSHNGEPTLWDWIRSWFQ